MIFGLSKIQLLLYAIAVALVVSLGIGAYHEIKDSGRQEERAKVKDERDKEKKRTDKLKEESDHAWQSKLDVLQTRIDSMLTAPGPAIRLCKPATKVRLPDAPTVANETAADSGSAVQAGGDIRRPLILYGGDCERTREQLSDLESWLTNATAKHTQ
jgi:FtsZ-binding cell division protein ZapB